MITLTGTERNNMTLKQNADTCQQNTPEIILNSEHNKINTSNYTYFSQQLQANHAEKSQMEIYAVFPGIEIAFNTFFASHIACHHAPSDTVLEINYCRNGRIGWNMKDNTAIYLGPGDLSLHNSYYCSDSDITLPTGFYEGLSISVDTDILQKHCPPYLHEADIDPVKLYENFCTDKPLTISTCHELENIFAPLYSSAAAPFKTILLKLKIQELLLYLYGFDPEKIKLKAYPLQHAQLIKEIHQYMTENLSQRFTIEQLSKHFLINTSTLKEVFKYVYGRPVAAYMKEYRIKKAMQLLKETDVPIADIAAQLGYKTQGKFSEAFKDITHILPSEYKKLNKL